jgi:protein-S-isoprenylcysteine O-methyltransferase Ste14
VAFGTRANKALQPPAARGSTRVRNAMLVLLRAISYAALFISLVLVFLPAQVLSRSGIATPESVGAPQAIGAVVTFGGAMVALWCILSFVFVGRGTPAPFDPPRRLVVRGPYAWVRNPMYIGAGVALLGASLFYQSLALLGYATVFFLVTHLFVVLYEEPALRGTFGAEYESYCHQVRRWWPRIYGRGHPGAA